MAVPTTTVNQFSDTVSDTTKTSFPIMAANGGVFTGNLINNTNGTGDVSDYFVIDILGGTHDTGAGSLGNTGSLTLNVQGNASGALEIHYGVVDYSTLNASGVPSLGGIHLVNGTGSYSIASTNWSGSGDLALVIRVASWPQDFTGNYTITLSNGTSSSGGGTGGGGTGGSSGTDLTATLYSVNTNTGLGGSASINATAGGSVILEDEFFNSGSTAASAGTIGYYISNDSTISSQSDRQFDYANLFNSIPANGSTGHTFTTVKLPSDLPTGDYYLGVIVNVTSSTTESNYNNNASAGRLIHVTATGGTGGTGTDGGNSNVVSYNGHSYQYVSFAGQARSWADASASAAALGGYLVTITSQAENDFITNNVVAGHLASGFNAAFIGASDAGHEGVWQWATGPEQNTTFWNGAANGTSANGQYAHWSSGEPNNAGGAENYAVMGSDGAWVDVPTLRDATFTTGFVVEIGTTTGGGGGGGGTSSTPATDLGTHGVSWPIAGVGDFNADGTSDILWRSPGTGQVDQWQMKNGGWSKSIDLGATKGAQWLLSGVGDFNADGTSDVLWRDISNSQVDQWQMKNGNWSKSIDLGTTKGAQWQLAGVGDFNADGTSDVLWRDVNNSAVDQWQMKNGNWSKSIDLGATKGSDWTLAGVGDFNGDGATDVLWRNLNTSQVDQWQMKAGTWSKSIDLGATKGADWQVAGTGDFNKDGTSDILWFNNKTGQEEYWAMKGGVWGGSKDLGVQNASWQPAGTGDFNHDAASDAIFLDPATGHVHEQLYML